MIISGTAIDAVGDRFEAINDVIARCLGDIDVMLQQLQIVPLCAIAKADGLKKIHVADQKDLFEILC